MRKGIGFWQMGLCLMTICATGALAAGPNVVVNGQEIPGTQTLFIGGHAMVPVRAVVDHIPETQANWDAARRQVTIVRGNDQVTLNVGSGFAHLNGEGIPLDVPVVLRNGVALMPARFAAEVLGAAVTYDARRNAVVIAGPEPGTRTLAYRETPQPKGAPAGSIGMGGQAILLLRTTGGYGSVEERATDVTMQLNNGLASLGDVLQRNGEFPSGGVWIAYSSGEPVLFVGKSALVHVTPDDAQAHGVSQRELAELWRRQAQAALTRIYGRPGR